MRRVGLCTGVSILDRPRITGGGQGLRGGGGGGSLRFMCLLAEVVARRCPP